MKKLSKVIAAGALLALGGIAHGASAEEFKANIFFPDTHPLTQYGYLEWAKTVEDLSGGEL